MRRAAGEDRPVTAGARVAVTAAMFKLNRSVRALAFMITGAALGACGYDEGAALGTDEQELRNAPMVLDRYRAVVKVQHQEDDGRWTQDCSGTLITPAAVLTAAHCICPGECTVGNLTDARRVIFTDVLPSTNPFAPTNLEDLVVAVRSVSRHPDYTPGDAHSWANDYAILRLDTVQSVTSHREIDDIGGLVQPIAPAIVRSSLMPTGEWGTLVGYGHWGSDCSITQDLDKRSGKVQLESYVTYSAPYGRKMIMHDGISVCQGDSGGPYFDAEGKVAGVISTGNPDTGLSSPDPTANAYAWLSTTACPFFDSSDVDASFCTDLCRCPTGDGDCDGDASCSAGAVCADDVGKVAGLDVGWDLCWDVDYLVRAYAATSFGGAVQELPPAVWTGSELSSVGDNGISSLRVPAGLTVRLCNGATGAGPCADFTTDTAILPAGMDNVASQVTVDPGVRLYDGASFTGAAQTFRAGTYAAAQLAGVGDNAASSLWAVPGVQARVCTEPNGTGTCRNLAGSVPGLASVISNQISYIQVRLGATVYEHADYAGASQTFAAGTHTSTAFTTIADNAVSSIVVAPGRTAMLCAGAAGTACAARSPPATTRSSACS